MYEAPCIYMKISRLYDQVSVRRPHRKFLHIGLDFGKKRHSIELSPPIQFRIEWADSQGMSPLLGCRPILFLDRHPLPHLAHHRRRRLHFQLHRSILINARINPCLIFEHGQNLPFFLWDA